MLDGYKELTPVVYGENGVKYLYAARKTPGELCFALHWHDRIELLCVERGSLRLNTAEGHEELCPGQVAVIGPRQLHGGIAGRDGVVYHTIMFDVEKLCNGTLASEKYLLPLCRNEVAFRRIVSDKQLLEAIYRLVGALTQSSREERAGEEAVKGEEEKKDAESRNMEWNPLLSTSVLYEILGILYRYPDKSARIQSGLGRGFEEILNYVNAHYVQKLSARDVSARFGYNETYFCRRFREITGFTFTRYIQALRMERAQKLLQEEAYGISAVAWKCGYEDVSYFSNCFRKHFGCSPTEFRKRR
jgi:AraC-like DNA-binding protein